MKIRMPATRAVYPASRNEPDRLLCWIPRHELEQLAAEGRVNADVLEYYPSGLEVRLSRPGFREVGLDLGVDPERLRDAYRALRRAGSLPASGVVAAVHLEQAAGDFLLPDDLTPHEDILTIDDEEAAPHDPLTSPEAAALNEPLRLPEPEWTEGEDARTVMGKLG